MGSCSSGIHTPPIVIFLTLNFAQAACRTSPAALRVAPFIAPIRLLLLEVFCSSTLSTEGVWDIATPAPLKFSHTHTDSEIFPHFKVTRMWHAHLLHGALPGTRCCGPQESGGGGWDQAGWGRRRLLQPCQSMTLKFSQSKNEIVLSWALLHSMWHLALAQTECLCECDAWAALCPQAACEILSHL